jgi:hypothetical protein
VVGAATVALCVTLCPAARLPADTWARLVPAAELLEEVMRTTVVEELAVPLPWFLSIQLTTTLPPGATLVGLKLIPCTTRSGPPPVTASVPGASVMSLLAAVPVWPDVLKLSAITQT